MRFQPTICEQMIVWFHYYYICTLPMYCRKSYNCLEKYQLKSKHSSLNPNYMITLFLWYVATGVLHSHVVPDELLCRILHKSSTLCDDQLTLIVQNHIHNFKILQIWIFYMFTFFRNASTLLSRILGTSTQGYNKMVPLQRGTNKGYCKVYANTISKQYSSRSNLQW